MTSTKGADVVASGWYKYSDFASENTPDINDSAGSLITTLGYVWAGGTPLASPDGGTWEGLITNLLLISWHKVPSGRLSQISSIEVGG